MICSNCNLDKNLDLFFKRKDGKKKCSSFCKECHYNYYKERSKLDHIRQYDRKRSLEYYYKNKESINKKQYRYRDYRIGWYYNNKNNKKINLGGKEYSYKELLEHQGGVCAICKKKETSRIKGTLKSLSVDHCHKTGNIRGLLCSRCNLTLGAINDNPELMFRMIQYINKNSNFLPLFQEN